jgi:hypothetical protein
MPVAPERSHAFGEYVSAQSAHLGFLESLSPGLQTRLRVAYGLNSFLRLDLDLIYVAGLPRFTEAMGDQEVLTYTQVRSSRFQVNPGLTLSLGERRFSPYVRLAGVFPGRYEVDLLVIEAHGNQEIAQQLLIEAKGLPGWTATLGMTYRLAKWIRVFYEVEYLDQRAVLLESTLIKYEVDGINALADLAPYQVLGAFQEGGELDNQPHAPSFDPMLPLALPTARQAIQAVGLHFGMVITFQ